MRKQKQTPNVPYRMQKIETLSVECLLNPIPNRVQLGQIDIAKRVFSLDPKEVAFAKRIVEALGGEIGARSSGTGGSTFYFDLPMGPLPAEPRAN